MAGLPANQGWNMPGFDSNMTSSQTGSTSSRRVFSSNDGANDTPSHTNSSLRIPSLRDETDDFYTELAHAVWEHETFRFNKGLFFAGLNLVSDINTEPSQEKLSKLLFDVFKAVLKTGDEIRPQQRDRPTALTQPHRQNNRVHPRAKPSACHTSPAPKRARRQPGPMTPVINPSAGHCQSQSRGLSPAPRMEVSQSAASCHGTVSGDSVERTFQDTAGAGEQFDYVSDLDFDFDKSTYPSFGSSDSTLQDRPLGMTYEQRLVGGSDIVPTPVPPQAVPVYHSPAQPLQQVAHPLLAPRNELHPHPAPASASAETPETRPTRPSGLLPKEDWKRNTSRERYLKVRRSGACERCKEKKAKCDPSHLTGRYLTQSAPADA